MNKEVAVNTNNSVEELVKKKSSGDKKKITYSELDNNFTSLETDFSNLKTLISNIQVKLRTVRKQQRQYSRELSKRARKKNDSDHNVVKKPKGFQLPIQLSKEMCEFLDIPEDKKLNCSEVAKEIRTYIKKNNLQDPNFGINIKPDSKLRNLLKVERLEQLTYFNLQKYLSKHYIKST